MDFRVAQYVCEEIFVEFTTDVRRSLTRWLREDPCGIVRGPMTRVRWDFVSENGISRVFLIRRVFGIPTEIVHHIFRRNRSLPVIDETYFSAFLPNFDDCWSASGVLLALLLMAKRDIDQ